MKKKLICPAAALAACLLLTACGGAASGSGSSSASGSSQPASEPASVSSPASESTDSGKLYLKSVTTARRGETAQVISYRYDKNGVRIETVDDNIAVSVKTTTVVTLNEEGLMASEDVQSPNEGYTYRHDYLYDDHGNVTETTLTMGDTLIVYNDEYEYDDQGRVTKHSLFIDGDPDESIEYEYDDTHELAVTERHYNGTGELMQTIVRDFDSKAAEGLYVETTTVHQTPMGEARDKVCHYRLDDGLLVYMNDTTSNNSLNELTYEYDDYGNMISCVGTDAGWEVERIYEYTYDEAGNILTCLMFSKGTEAQQDTYEYAPLSEVLYTA